MPRIRLPKGEWEYSETNRLGDPGGFGEVFEGKGADGVPVAIKRLRLSASDAAHRELDIAAALQGKKLNHVMEILDAGQDAESDQYFVVMPKAEGSLQAHLKAKGPMDDKSAVSVLLEIVRGLQEVPEITHRDLKPANVLMHDARWKIADFGIARFVEDATSTRTLRECLSPPYAAPEQWRLERATGATDVYALGCIGYALLTGKLPFPGPTSADFQEQHLVADPPPLAGHDPRLCSMLSMLLRKAPSARPSAERARKLLEGIGADRAPIAPAGELAAGAAAGARRLAEEEARAAAVSREREERAELRAEALRILRALVHDLFAAVQGVAPTAKVQGPEWDGGGLVLVPAEHDGEASLVVQVMTTAFSKDAFKHSGWDVLMGASIHVRQPHDGYVWSASLWYMRHGAASPYRWVEVSYYFAYPSGGGMPPHEPHALTDAKDADHAAAHLSGQGTAFGPEPIDDENATRFIDRWCALLGKAVRGRLGHPGRLPLLPPYTG